MGTDSPLAELLEWKAIGETLSTDTNALQHTVAVQLVEHQAGLQHTRLFLLVGNDATHEVWLRVAKVDHELVERFLQEIRQGKYSTSHVVHMGKTADDHRHETWKRKRAPLPCGSGLQSGTDCPSCGMHLNTSKKNRQNNKRGGGGGEGKEISAKVLQQ